MFEFLRSLTIIRMFLKLLEYGLDYELLELLDAFSKVYFKAVCHLH